MGLLSTSWFGVGGFIVVLGLLLVTDAPYVKSIRDGSEWLKRNNRLLGTAIALLGFLIMGLSAP